jgi:4-carboxymuconolactone decarboxylase
MNDPSAESGAERRQRGLARMNEVYGFDYSDADLSGKFIDATLEHLFADIWSRSALSDRDRRLMTLGVVAALGQTEPMEVIMNSALREGELTAEQIEEAVVYLTHYVGWPLGTLLLSVSQKVLGQPPARPPKLD